MRAPEHAGGEWAVGRAGRADWTFRQEGVSGAGSLVEGALTYTADGATSVIATRARGGLEIFYVIDDTSTARSWRWQVDGANLTSGAAEGSVLVSSRGRGYRITAPVAIDADGGRHPVRLAVLDRNRLEISVEAGGRAPMLVDPVIEIVEWRELSGGPRPPHDSAIVYDEARGVTIAYLPRNSSPPEIWQWDGLEWAALERPSASASHHWPVMAYVAATSSIVLFGGAGGDEALTTSDDTWTWDGSAWTQVDVDPAPPPRFSAAIAYDPERGRAVVFGGAVGATRDSLDDTWEWDGHAWFEMTPTRHPSARSEHAMAWDPERRAVVLYGGHAGTTRFDDLWEWDGSDWRPRASEGAPALVNHFLVHDPAGGGLLMGGGSTASVEGRNTYRLTGSTWSVVGQLPSERTRASAAVDTGRGHVLLFGGLATTDTVTLSGPLAWTGTEWSFEWPERGPRFQHSTTASGAYDSSREVIWLSALSATDRITAWEFRGNGYWRRPDVLCRASDGSMWFDASRRVTYVNQGGLLCALDGSAPPTGVPAAWVNHIGEAAAYDVVRREAVLFGGRLRSGAELDETWTFDGRDWTQKLPASAPPARVGHAMTFDVRRGVVVLFGGWAGGSDLSDTWEWDGTDWTNVTAAGPAPRHDHGLAFDPDRGVVLLAGGVTATDEELGDAWEWDGSAWREVTGPGMPTSDERVLLIYQEDRHRMLYFRRSSGAAEIETWERLVWRAAGSDCTDDTECESGACVDGICVAIDAGLLDAGAGTAGSDGEVPLDARSRRDAATRDAAGADGGSTGCTCRVGSGTSARGSVLAAAFLLAFAIRRRSRGHRTA